MGDNSGLLAALIDFGSAQFNCHQEAQRVPPAAGREVRLLHTQLKGRADDGQEQP
ncbi:hypothetical protein PR003_g5172 [Phytophthora rubi]|uniref:Uncharacterized protein n=1 Tax=Phytophthora rubi TaxID=129364 RepID=A0A6A4FT40_9STRA|nr:hypothetical protein PR003_g5172 [Phytophthora rubi]